MSGVTFGVLGPLEALRDGVPADLKGPRHRAVLARLLVAGGRVVPVSRLIDDLWTDPPEGALGAVQTFVAALRRALEPDRPPRTPARLLVTVPPGYALRPEPQAVDAWRFEAAVREAGEPAPAGAFERLDEALAMWRGPAYAEFAEEDWARGEAIRLDELRLLAVERRAEAALALGRAAASVPDLERHVESHPLREDGWRLLALALYQSGRQADALGALRRARALLRTELGLDPGEGLRRLETDILAQAPHLSARGDAPSTVKTGPGAPPPLAPPPGQAFVGRASELADLAKAADAVIASGRPVLALLSGDAGAGKTALAEALSAELAARGWTTARGASPEGDGAPASWPWARIAESLGQTGRPSPSSTDPLEARFRRHRAIAAYLAKTAAQSPVLLVFDDLHWATEETLALMTALATDPTAGPVLIVGTYRSTEISPTLTEALGRSARAEPARIYLGGLAEGEVAELVRVLAGRDVDPGTARLIHRRSAGNPFFARELTRLLDTEGDLNAVPAGVRDVIRQRLARLPESARAVLRQAAVIGPDVDLDVLITLAGDEEAVLDAAEAALLAGFLTEPDPDRLRFAHALVREVLYEDAPRARLIRWHARIADILEQSRPDQVETIAHHLVRASSRATAARTARYARAAAERADERVAPHEAARWWREAVAATAGDSRAHLEAVMGLVRALAVTGDLDGARRLRAEAITEAERLAEPLLTAQVIGSFDVPANWTTVDDPARAAHVVAAAERALADLPARHDAERARLLGTIALELRADSGERGGRAAREAAEIARRLGDPALLAFALNARYLQSFGRAGLAPERARIAAELVGLSARHGLVTSEVLGHLILVQSHAALADLSAADEHAAAADKLAERYELPLVGVFTEWYAALRLAATGRADEAEPAYRRAAARLAGTGMRGVEDGILPLALLSLRLQESRPASDLADMDFGPYEPWARPLILNAEGRHEDAKAASRRIPDSPHDLLFEARTCLHAQALLELGGDRTALEKLHADLLPAAGELAGAGSGMLTLGPVSDFLNALATA
ncbi:BTAD domain-containing putative transcriptional regulator [Spirillospora sp. NPDC048911]|uniref:BTAD domain-containing putative transcriptional regulator n=1 Tax=Spirillospora sp. NPDC048911 TaxID=3364527 RepID=UPI003721D4FD